MIPKRDERLYHVAIFEIGGNQKYTNWLAMPCQVSKRKHKITHVGAGGTLALKHFKKSAWNLHSRAFQRFFLYHTFFSENRKS